MDCSTKSTLLVTTCIFLLLNIIGAQDNVDAIQICELCQADGFLDCNLTDKINIYMTMNCDKACTLGIDKSFANFDNLTMDNINNEQICVFKNESGVTTEHPISLVTDPTEGYEALDTSTEGTFEERITVDGSLDYQNDGAVENQPPSMNRMPWKECYQCNSHVNPNCALWSNVDTVPTAICPVSNDNCLTRITADGDTIRDCSRLDFKCANDEKCSVCAKSLCNVGVFPEGRLRCIQCQECENDQDPSSALPCARYDAHEECFLYVTAKSRMIRGCVSNTTEMEQCRMNKPKCISCGDKNGCNSMPLTKDPVLSCSKCKSKDNPSCAWAQPPNAVAKCQNKVLYYLQETCMTEFDPVTQDAVRDCSFDNGVCTPEDNNCHTCSGNGCNRGNLKVQQCVQCNSELPDQIKCGHRAEGITPTNCPQEVQLFNSKGCFVMTKGNITIRGCKLSLKEDDLKFCQKEGKARCLLCDEDGCNIQLMPSRGWRNVPLYLFALVGGLFVTI